MLVVVVLLNYWTFIPSLNTFIIKRAVYLGTLLVIFLHYFPFKRFCSLWCNSEIFSILFRTIGFACWFSLFRLQLITTKGFLFLMWFWISIFLLWFLWLIHIWSTFVLCALIVLIRFLFALFNDFPRITPNLLLIFIFQLFLKLSNVKLLSA